MIRDERPSSSQIDQELATFLLVREQTFQLGFLKTAGKLKVQTFFKTKSQHLGLLFGYFSTFGSTENRLF